MVFGYEEFVCAFCLMEAILVHGHQTLDLCGREGEGRGMMMVIIIRGGGGGGLRGGR